MSDLKQAGFQVSSLSLLLVLLLTELRDNRNSHPRGIRCPHQTGDILTQLNNALQSFSDAEKKGLQKKVSRFRSHPSAPAVTTSF